MSGVRLDRLLGNLGYGSRKEIAHFVKAGRVELHGAKVTRADQNIADADARSGALTFDGERIDPPAPMTLMLNKPAGYICSHDEKGRLIYELLPERWQGRKPLLSCAGRLDKESTGQVILTDDGDLLHRIIHPKSHAQKHYAVTLAQPLRGDETALFTAGDFLMKGDVKPLKPATWTPDGEKSGVMILSEGRFHQIRRMFETLGNEVVGLHRFKTGGLEMGGLPVGQWQLLEYIELERIFISPT